jgi:hypothetical protein
MAVGVGIANVEQLATTQQKKNIYVSKIPLASKKQQEQIEDPEESQQLAQHHRNISTSTAYVEDTNVMVSPNTRPETKIQLSNIHPRK